MTIWILIVTMSLHPYVGISDVGAFESEAACEKVARIIEARENRNSKGWRYEARCRPEKISADEQVLKDK